MARNDAHRLNILTGPSCTGKTPLMHCLRSQRNDWMTQTERIVLYNSRPKRPLEYEGVDYFFRPRCELEAMVHAPRMVVLDVRGDLQALDVEAILKKLETHSLLFDGNPFIAEVLSKVKRLESVPLRSVFISPLSKDEIRDILALQNPEEIVAEVMRTKLLKRARKQKGNLSLPDLQTIEYRARSAWSEIKMSPMFDAVVVNHDGEDSDNWNAFPILLGEARKTRDAVHEFFQKGTSDSMEKWTADLFKPVT